MYLLVLIGGMMEPVFANLTIIKHIPIVLEHSDWVILFANSYLTILNSVVAELPFESVKLNLCLPVKTL